MCVVEPEQVWCDHKDARYRVRDVIIAAGAMASATVVLEPIQGGPREPISAAVLCQGDSGWTRLPDPPCRSRPELPRLDDEPDTAFFDSTFVGLGPKPRA